MMYSVKMRSSKGGAHGYGGRHISGAEQIVSAESMDAAVLAMLHRARAHERGQADFINLKVEEIQPEQVVYCPLLPVYQMDTRTKNEGRQRAREELLRIGVSDRAVTSAFQLLESLTDSMRGAAVIDAESGRRLDDLKERGVRCSSMDAADAAHFEAVMTSRGMGGDHPREALVLASKVAYARGTVAELCWSDDPDYVTGYVGSKRFGYGRITVMKDLGDPVGGRVFFVAPGTDMKAYEDYMQNRPVLVRTDDESI
ncbi:MAG: 6-carboxyhexanoate--CoA ligase [Dialister sp.]|nr:6-carboxyhexanoate--CoA ligase [Dialister sp.]